MTVKDFLAFLASPAPEFWAALFGALAAFLLGAAGSWWAARKRMRSAGNLALVTLTQMYSHMEGIRQHLLEEEAARMAAFVHRDPFTVEVRAMVGLPDTVPQLHPRELGFLVDSHDPDILNRLLTVERAFSSTLSLAKRHLDLHTELQERLGRLDGMGTQQYRVEQLPALVGIPLVIQIDDTVTGLVRALPDTCNALVALSSQLVDVLRMQFPFGMFLEFKVVRDRRLVDLPPGAGTAALWRRALRSTVMFLRKRRQWTLWWSVPAQSNEPVTPQAKPPQIKPFPRPE